MLITTDTQRCDTLGCMGSPFAVSPNIDRLAREGVMFTQAHTAAPVCQPARCSLLTGQHTHIHGCIENGFARRTDLPVFTDYLREQGYHNILVGKSHFDPVPDSFDVVHLTDEKGRDVRDSYADYLKPFGIARDSTGVAEEHYMDGFIVDTTIAEIQEALSSGTAPFFAHCSLISPHAPIDPPGDWRNLYADAALPPLNYTPGEEARYPEHLRSLVGPLSDAERSVLGEKAIRNIDQRNDVGRVGADTIDALRRRYYGLAAYVDSQVGRLVSYLDERGLREETLIIFSSDHGAEFFDHGFNNKHNYHDATWRVPLIMSMPGTLPQAQTRGFAVWTDIPATILGAAGADCSAFQGFDLFTPVSKGHASPRTCAVATLYKSAALATERWKLEYYFEQGTGRLFDREADPAEQQDLFGDEQYRGVREHLLRALLTWRADSMDVSYLHSQSFGAGPVASRIKLRTSKMRGSDAEERLQASVRSY